MNLRKVFSIILLLFGEALIIIGFRYFGNDVDTKLISLNIVVSSIIYLLFFIDLLFPMIDFSDKSQKTVGSLGLRWFVTISYMIVAIALMLVFYYVKPININALIIINAILFFILLLGLYFAVSASAKVQSVYEKEEEMRDYITEMKNATKDVQHRLNQLDNIPANIVSKIEKLEEDIRYVSPSNNREAHLLEESYIKSIKLVKDCFFDTPINYEKVTEHIQNCERIYSERKEIYSN